MDKRHRLTQQGYDNLREELRDLTENQRVANKIALKEAREQGDLSENADYDAARNEQAKIESRVNEIEYILKNAEIIKAKDDDTIDIGKKVTIEDAKSKEQHTFAIVSSIEANPFEYKISNASALGRALVGREIGDVVSYSSETGLEFNVKILKVEN